MFRKECGLEHGFAKNPLPLPGFNIGLSSNSRTVVKNGLPTSKYHWKSDWRQLASVPVKSAYLTFFLSVNVTNLNAQPGRLHCAPPARPSFCCCSASC